MLIVIFSLGIGADKACWFYWAHQTIRMNLNSETPIVAAYCRTFPQNDYLINIKEQTKFIRIV